MSQHKGRMILVFTKSLSSNIHSNETGEGKTWRVGTDCTVDILYQSLPSYLGRLSKKGAMAMSETLFLDHSAPPATVSKSRFTGPWIVSLRMCHIQGSVTGLLCRLTGSQLIYQYDERVCHWWQESGAVSSFVCFGLVHLIWYLQTVSSSMTSGFEDTWRRMWIDVREQGVYILLPKFKKICCTLWLFFAILVDPLLELWRLKNWSIIWYPLQSMMVSVLTSRRRHRTAMRGDRWSRCPTIAAHRLKWRIFS